MLIKNFYMRDIFVNLNNFILKMLSSSVFYDFFTENEYLLNQFYVISLTNSSTFFYDNMVIQIFAEKPEMIYSIKAIFTPLVFTFTITKDIIVLVLYAFHYNATSINDFFINFIVFLNV